MKKIVALVLSLVMALSLCTVAFGVIKTTGTALYKVDGNKNVAELKQDGGIDSVKEVTKANGSGYIAHYEITWAGQSVLCYEYTKANTENYYVAVDEWTAEIGAELVADGYVLTMGDNGFGKQVSCSVVSCLIPCEQADAEYAIYENGAFVAWVFEGTDAAAYYEKAVVAQAATTAKPNCTTSQFFEDGFVADGHFYVESSAVNAFPVKADGKIVFVLDKTYEKDYVIWASHIFAKGVKNTTTGYDVATCLICKGEFACTNNEAVATKNGYKISTGFEYKTFDANNVYEANKYENGYDFAWGQTYADDYKFVWQLKAGTTEEIGTADKAETPAKGVESAKTFDAGIAMYVGMSLMSVAGTAVVIGKKKEF